MSRSSRTGRPAPRRMSSMGAFPIIRGNGPRVNRPQHRRCSRRGTRLHSCIGGRGRSRSDVSTEERTCELCPASRMPRVRLRDLAARTGLHSDTTETMLICWMYIPIDLHELQPIQHQDMRSLRTQMDELHRESCQMPRLRHVPLERDTDHIQLRRVRAQMVLPHRQHTRKMPSLQDPLMARRTRYRVIWIGPQGRSVVRERGAGGEIPQGRGLRGARHKHGDFD